MLVAGHFAGNKHTKSWPGWVAVARSSGFDVLHILAIVYVWTQPLGKFWSRGDIYRIYPARFFIAVFGVWAYGKPRLSAIE